MGHDEGLSAILDCYPSGVCLIFAASQVQHKQAGPLRRMGGVASADPRTSPPSSKPLRIFVVEDHEDTAKYLCLYLELLGHSTVCAGTMTQALKKLPRAGCDVLLCDISLPDGNGWDLLLLLNAQLLTPTYAIAISALVGEPARATSKKFGFRHHLDKPFQPSELVALLNDAASSLVGSRAAGATPLDEPH